MNIAITASVYEDKKTRTVIDMGALLDAGEPRPGNVIAMQSGSTSPGTTTEVRRRWRPQRRRGRSTHRGDRRKEGKVNEMKYRKVQATKEELAKVPIHEVAKIAAALVQNPGSVALKDSPPEKDSDDGKTTRGKATTQKPLDEEGPLVVATAKAFELLEIAYYGKSGLRKEDSYEAGLAEFVEGKKSGEEFLRWSHRFPGGAEYDEQGQPLPVPFDEGLKMLIPLPGYSEKRAKDDTMVLFQNVALAFLFRARAGRRDAVGVVGNMIAEMKQN